MKHELANYRKILFSVAFHVMQEVGKTGALVKPELFSFKKYLWKEARKEAEQKQECCCFTGWACHVWWNIITYVRDFSMYLMYVFLCIQPKFLSFLSNLFNRENQIFWENHWITQEHSSLTSLDYFLLIFNECYQ